MADHRRETGVDLALLAAADLVDGRSHIVVDAPPRHAAQDTKSVVMGVKQHLMGLLRIGPENEGAAIGELEVSDLQFGPLAGDDRPIFRPVELERLARQKRQRHEPAAAARLLFLLPSGLAVASESRHAIVRAVVAEGGQISVQLLDRPLLLARLPPFLPQHLRQLVGVRVQLARAVRDVELRFNGVRAQVFADCVPRQTGASGYLSDREMVPIAPASDDAKYPHADPPDAPCLSQGGEVPTWVSSRWKN